MEPTPLDEAVVLMSGFIPEGTVLTIEECDSPFCNRYIFRLLYTSQKTGKTMVTAAKGNNLPNEPNELMWFYLRQIIIQPSDVALEFSRMAWREKRAKQELWLALGKNSRAKDGNGDTLTVNDEGLKGDLMKAFEYDPATQMDIAMEGSI